MRSITHFVYGFDIYNDADIIGQIPTPEFDQSLTLNNDLEGEEGWRVGTPVDIDSDGELEVTDDGEIPQYYLKQDVVKELDYQKWVNDVKIDVTTFENAAAVYIGGRGKIMETALIHEDSSPSVGDEIGVLDGYYATDGDTSLDFSGNDDPLGVVIDIGGTSEEGHVLEDSIFIMLYQ